MLVNIFFHRDGRDQRVAGDFCAIPRTGEHVVRRIQSHKEPEEVRLRVDSVSWPMVVSEGGVTFQERPCLYCTLVSVFHPRPFTPDPEAI